MHKGFGMPERKAPSNPRYAGTKTRLDTGPNMRKVLEQHQGPQFAHKKKGDEYFVRLRPTTLGHLLGPLVENEESVFSLANNHVDDGQHSVATSVVPSSVGGAASEGNIIIYDCRPFEEFEQCHVYGARHYDPTNLNKSTNQFPREVYYFRGPVECDKMVVIYDEDGKSAASLGNAFVQKGIENTYVVSGGFLMLCATCPHVLVGHPPSDETLDALMGRAGLKPPGAGARSARGSGGSPSARCSTAGSVRTAASNLSYMNGSGSVRAWK